MEALHQNLRALVAIHGFEMVHTTLQGMMRQDYDFLVRLYGLPVAAPVSVAAPVPVPVPVVVTVVEPVVSSTDTNTKVKNVKITVKKAAPQPEPPQPEPTPTPTPTPLPQHQNTLEQPTEEKKFRSPAEMKEFQRLAVEKKRAELDAQGVSAKSILTKENLKMWVEDDGNTYAWVAREKAGCDESEVSAIAKTYGIVSKISKRRGMVIAKKKQAAS